MSKEFRVFPWIPWPVFSRHKKSPALPGFFIKVVEELLDLRFLVDNVLANDGIELLDLHLFGHVALVLVGGVEVAGTGAGHQTDLIAC
jgi:hypothetical protein